MESVVQPSAKAAFEVEKGVRQVMTLSESEVKKYLGPEEPSR
jgi:hypothetical protein